MTPLQQFNEKWRDGCGAEECSGHRTRVCVPRANGPQGSIPCDVLFIGEAPGFSENTFGVVLCGPAGHLFDRMRDRALRGLPLTWAATNVVGCIPLVDGDKTDEPSLDQVNACRPRLSELVALARPRLVVRMGKVAEKWTEPGMRDSPGYPPGVRFAKVLHPAAMFPGRMTVAQIGLETQRWSVVVRTACEALLEGTGGTADDIPY